MESPLESRKKATSSKCRGFAMVHRMWSRLRLRLPRRDRDTPTRSPRFSSSLIQEDVGAMRAKKRVIGIPEIGGNSVLAPLSRRNWSTEEDSNRQAQSRGVRCSQKAYTSDGGTRRTVATSWLRSHPLLRRKRMAVLVAWALEVFRMRAWEPAAGRPPSARP